MPRTSTTSMPKTLTEIGNEAKRAAQREALLEMLEEKRWSLVRTARALCMGGPSNVLRAIDRLGLIAEYEAARQGGLVTHGPRKEPTQENPRIAA